MRTLSIVNQPAVLCPMEGGNHWTTTGKCLKCIHKKGLTVHAEVKCDYDDDPLKEAGE